MGLLRVILLHAAQYSLIVFAISLSPPNSLIRVGLLPVIFALSLYILPLVSASVPTKVQASFIATNIDGVLLQYLDLGLISRWSFGARGPTSTDGGRRSVRSESEGYNAGTSHPDGASVAERLQWGFSTVAAWRAPGTVWQAKGTPAFDQRRPGWSPNRAQFVGWTFGQLVFCWLLLDLMGLLPQTSAQEKAEMFAWQNVAFFGRISDVTAEHVVARMFSTLLFWAATYCILQVFYCSVAIVAVTAGNATPEAWPPLFGSITQCFSMRRFWGQFWHQALRQQVGGPGVYLTYSVLGLAKGRLVGRYLCVLLTFAVSGAFHVAQEYTAGVPLEQSGSMRFYCTQLLGFVIEDAAKALFVWAGGRRRSGWIRVAGYIWVVAWLTWTSPAWFYPKLVNNAGTSKDRVLPFSLIRLGLSASGMIRAQLKAGWQGPARALARTVSYSA